MANEYDVLGQLIKDARLNTNLTRNELAERIGLSARYLASVENEGRKPSYSALYKIIRTLGIDANTIFYPENGLSNERRQIVRMIDLCDEHSFKIIAAAVREAVKHNKE